MSRKSILPHEMFGVMHITGKRGIGKSYLASQSDFPDNIVFLDFENKGEGIDRQLKFGEYHAVTRSKNKGENSPLDIFERFDKIIEGIEQDRFTVAILDNISWLELALRAEANRNVEQYVKDYNLNLKNVKANRFGGLSAVVNNLVSDLVCNRLHEKGIRLIVVTSHVKEKWGSAGPIPNKWRIKGADRWQELSICTLVLINGDKPPVPSAIVMKEQLGTIAIDVTKMTDDEYEQMQRGELGHDVQRRLPLRLPKATFQEIRRYLANPANINEPKQGEMPTSAERDPYSDKLSNEQITFMREVMRHKEMEDIKAKQEDDARVDFERESQVKTIEDDVRKLLGEGKDIPTISQELDVPVPAVAQAVMRIKGE